MMPSDEAEAPVEYLKGSIGAIADRYARTLWSPTAAFALLRHVQIHQVQVE